MSTGIPRRPLGRTGEEVSILGLGGAHIGQLSDETLAIRLMHEAIDEGITFFDNAWEYAAGAAEERMGRALKGRRDQVFLMSKVCSHGRGREVALRQLEDSLRRLRTDHLDLWQVHEVVYENDPELHHAKGGVLEALEEARRAGKVRFVGFTGHKDPAIHLKMLGFGHRWDTCQLPLNPLDGTFRSFEQRVLPVLHQRGIAAIAMKTLCGNGSPVRAAAYTVEDAFRYVWSLPIATLVTGIDSPEVLRQNVDIARRFRAMSRQEQEALRSRCAKVAADGRFELFKTSIKYDADTGRTQHGYPSMSELPG